MIYTKEELKRILENDFLLNPQAFSRGRTNDDVVDSMCICHCLEYEWTELFAKWVDNYTIIGPESGEEYINHSVKQGSPVGYGSREVPFKDREIKRILEHYERIKPYLIENPLHGKARWGRIGTMDAMDYTINY